LPDRRDEDSEPHEPEQDAGHDLAGDALTAGIVHEIETSLRIPKIASRTLSVVSWAELALKFGDYAIWSRAAPSPVSYQKSLSPHVSRSGDR